VSPGSPSWYRCTAVAPKVERKCQATPACVVSPTRVAACHLDSGWCCSGGPCHIVAGSPKCATGCSSLGYALLERGRCEDIACSGIEDFASCGAAAASFGFTLAGGASATAALLITSYMPSFCVWEQKNINNEGAALWFNLQRTMLSSTTQFGQLCKCGKSWSARSYSWRVGPWSECSLGCGRQQKVRQVTCILSEPAQAEPCASSACFTSQVNTRCGGQVRPVIPSEVGTMAKHVLATTGGKHCVEMPLASYVADLCRRSCLKMGDCVGFTQYESLRSSQVFAQCCFLQKATR